MLVSRLCSRALLVALVWLPLSAATMLRPRPASAASIAVKLRVEGSSKTLVERTLGVEAIPEPPGLETAGSEGKHPCDVKDNGFNEGFGPSAATPTAALYDGALAEGLAFDATWSKSFNDFFVTQVGADVNGGEPEFPPWGYAVNFTTAGVGGCQFQLAPGSEVLWAYNYFNLAHLLALSGPSAVSVGAPFTVHVSDGQTGEPISGATLGEVVAGSTVAIPASPTTDAGGDATVTLSHAGSATLKASRSDSVRSNGLQVCVHNGNDGTCGTSPPSAATPTSSVSQATQTSSASTVAAFAVAAGVKNGHVYSRRRAPRILAGSVRLPPGSSLRQVRIRLERQHHGRCFDFSGRREAFVVARRCGEARFFSVGATQSFTYLLPSRLPAGRYVYDVQALDASGRATKLVGGVSHVIFRVR